MMMMTKIQETAHGTIDLSDNMVKFQIPVSLCLFDSPCRENSVAKISDKKCFLTEIWDFQKKRLFLIFSKIGHLVFRFFLDHFSIDFFEQRLIWKRKESWTRWCTFHGWTVIFLCSKVSETLYGKPEVWRFLIKILW